MARKESKKAKEPKLKTHRTVFYNPTAVLPFRTRLPLAMQVYLQQEAEKRNTAIPVILEEAVRDWFKANGVEYQHE